MKDVVHATVIEIIEIMKYIARTYADATEDEYNAAAREALAAEPSPAAVQMVAALLLKRHQRLNPPPSN